MRRKVAEACRLCEMKCDAQRHLSICSTVVSDISIIAETVGKLLQDLTSPRSGGHHLSSVTEASEAAILCGSQEQGCVDDVKVADTDCFQIEMQRMADYDVRRCYMLNQRLLSVLPRPSRP